MFLHFVDHFSLPNSSFLPPSSPVLFPCLPDFPVRGDWSVLSPEGYVLGREPEESGTRLQPPLQLSRLWVWLLCFLCAFLCISQGWIPLGGEFESIGILHRLPPPPTPTAQIMYFQGHQPSQAHFLRPGAALGWFRKLSAHLPPCLHSLE